MQSRRVSDSKFQKNIFRSLSLQKLIEMVAGPGEDLREMIARLEQQELDCQVMEDLHT